jgi:hypothetical protein
MNPRRLAGCRLVGGAAAVYGVQRRRRFVRCGVWTGCTEGGFKTCECGNGFVGEGKWKIQFGEGRNGKCGT